MAPEPLQAPITPIDAPTTGTISIVQNRDLIELDGVVEAVRVADHGGSPAVEADFVDGTGQLRLVWLGRQKIAGICEGVGIHIEGRVGDCSGVRTVFNPRYVLTSPSDD
ncbi:hypothetical protein Back2_02540 [Nocardioides baekrokdamisoli]|uniref:DNA-binding protein n=1 Tax=Nocardioides baekrokdamisoli TaxID=1804624 RepID=A0A3G9IB12_9ACTN|nr:OB-fold nucleic acid binding domain-containing protein [Nocardioides baekrokdamisoli]BBH15967.1 hypothetical protein Back2_02540 [Nocardioides baekrokdamisoli]